MNPFVRRHDPHMLVVGMAGVKLGDRIVQIGCAHGGRLAAIAGKVGLSGRAVVVAPDDASAERARKGAEQAGVLVEIEMAPPTRLPFDAGSFDLALVDDIAGAVGALGAEDRARSIRELLRVLRPGGRAMIVGAAPRTGLAAVFSRAPTGPTFVASGEANKALQADGFKSARTLAERDGMIFVEGVKPRDA